MLSAIQLVSILGSLLVLLAYVANQFGWLRTQGLAYAFANIAGSGILAVIAALEAQWGFLLLEGAWASVSLVAVLRRWIMPNKHRDPRSSGLRKIGAFGRVVSRMWERRANLTQGEPPDRADELWFEMSKGMV